jgi:hypothetical protein
VTARHVGIRRVAVGAVAAIAFAIAYVIIAPPARRWAAEHVVAPALATAADSETAITVRPRASPPSVVVDGPAGELAAYSIPLGIMFAIPALLLIAIAPGRPYWLLFGAFLVVLGLLDLAAVGAGVAWGRSWFTVHQFVDLYVIRPSSIAIPLLLLEYHRRRVAP